MAELTAWSMMAASMGPEYDKALHMTDWPTEAEILKYAALVPDGL